MNNLDIYRVPSIWRVTLRIIQLGVEWLIDVSTTKIVGCAEDEAPILPDVNLFGLVGCDFNVSERHFLIGMDTSGLYLIDQGSAMGTWLNGISLSPFKAQALNDGDLIKMGDLELRVSVVKNPFR